VERRATGQMIDLVRDARQAEPGKLNKRMTGQACFIVCCI